MARQRTELEATIGKLIAAVQKEWQFEGGLPESTISEEVMPQSHALLLAASRLGSISDVIGADSVASFLGAEWVQAHPRVWPFIDSLEAAR